MRPLVTFVLGGLCGAALAAWILGVAPPEPPAQVTLLTRPAPPPAPAAAAVTQEKEASPMAAAAPEPDAAPTVALAEGPPAAAVPAQVSVAAPAPLPPSTSASPAPRPGALRIPVAGVAARQLADSFNEVHSGSRHEAIDIMAPRGTPVFAVEDGRIAKLFTSKPGGLTIYQFDPSERFAYYYAHLDKYAEGLAEGRQVKRGDVIGYVGSTGNASPQAPHLHFSIFVLGPEKKWWKGTAIDPYPLLAANP